MSKQLATKEETGLSIANIGSFGVENVLSSDLRIPKILLMQAMSDLVSERKAVAGDFVESFEGKKLGDDKAPVKIIPFYITNTWTIKKEVNGKMEFEKIEDRGGADTRREYETIGSDGVKRTNHRTLNVFCLIKGGNLNVPYMLSLQNASFKKGAQPLLNKVQLLKTENKAPAHVVFELGVETEENDKGRWFSTSITASKGTDGKDIPTSIEELTAAYNQYKAISGAIEAGAKVDMSDVEEEAPAKAEPQVNKAKY